MSRTRLLVGLLAASLLGLVPVGLGATAAHAAETTIAAEISASRAVYGDTFYISGNASCAGDSYADGDIVLLRRKAGTDAWTELGRDSAGAFFFGDLRAAYNAEYALAYPGGGVCEAATITTGQKVHRDLNDRVKSRTLTLKGKVAPKWKRKPVVVEVKKGRRWVTYDRVRTNRRSKWSKRLYTRAGGKRTYFRAYVKGTKTYEKSFTSTYYTYRFREAPALRRAAR